MTRNRPNRLRVSEGRNRDLPKTEHEAADTFPLSWLNTLFGKRSHSFDIL